MADPGNGGPESMQVVVTTGAVRHEKFRSNHHHQQTNTQLFYMPDALPVTQPTVSEHLIQNHEESCYLAVIHNAPGIKPVTVVTSLR